jgi:hypothetical protein
MLISTTVENFIARNHRRNGVKTFFHKDICSKKNVTLKNWTFLKTSPVTSRAT